MSTVEQSRHLATAIPGPRSSELIARKNAAVSRGVGTTMPVYAARAFGGIVEDVEIARREDRVHRLMLHASCSSRQL